MKTRYHLISCLAAGVFVLANTMIASAGGPGGVETATNTFGAGGTNPYQESFETFAPGFRFFGEGSAAGEDYGWYGTPYDEFNLIMVTNVNYHWGNNYPITNANLTHTNVLYIEGVVTNRFLDPQPGEFHYVHFDMMLDPMRSYEPELTVFPHVDSNAQMAVYINREGYLTVWHSIDDGEGGFANAWTSLEGAHKPIDTEDWIRLTISIAYQWNNYFSIRLNEGYKLVHPTAYDDPESLTPSAGGVWFRSPSQDNLFISEVVFSGDGTYLDDLVVRTDDPLPTEDEVYIAVTNLTPALGDYDGATNVTFVGIDREFKLLPAPGYGVFQAVFYSHGVIYTQASPRVAFTNVQGDEWLEFSFAPSLTAQKSSGKAASIAANPDYAAIRPAPEYQALADGAYNPETMSFTLGYELYSTVTNTIAAGQHYHIVSVVTNGADVVTNGVPVVFGQHSEFKTNYVHVWENFDVWLDNGDTNNSLLYAVFNIDGYNAVVASSYDGLFNVIASEHQQRHEDGAILNAVDGVPLTFDWHTLMNVEMATPQIPATNVQHVLAGWTASGNDGLESLQPGLPNEDNLVDGVYWESLAGTTPAFGLTNNTALTYYWTTNYMLQVSQDGEGAVTMVLEDNQTQAVQNGPVANGREVRITASDFTDFEKWEGDTNGVTFVETMPGFPPNIAIVPMDQPREITAHFKNKRLTVISEQGGANPESGVWQYDDVVDPHYITNSPLILETNVRYEVTGWLHGGSVPAYDSNVHDATNVPSFTIQQDSSITWLWMTQHWFAASSEAVEGLIEVKQPAPAGPTDEFTGWFESTADLELEAQANEGYAFVEWQGDLDGIHGDPTDATLSFTMGPERRLVTAVFEGLPVDVTVTSLWGGAWLDGVFIDDGVATNYSIGASLTGSEVTNSPLVTAAGTTQYVAIGWTANPDGNAPLLAEAVAEPDPAWLTQHTAIDPFSISTTNATQIEWNWATNVWLDLSVNGLDGFITVETNSAVLYGDVKAVEEWIALGAELTLTAAPTNGYTFRTWGGDTNGIADDLTGLTITVPMDRARTLVAAFSHHTVDVVSEHGTVELNDAEIMPGTIFNDPSLYATSFPFETVFTNAVTTPTVNDGVATQYVLQGWTGTGSITNSAAAVNGYNYVPQHSNAVSDALGSDTTVTWQWGTNYWLATATAGNGGVTVTNLKTGGLSADFPAENTGINDWVGAETQVRIEPFAGSGSEFSHWSGNVPPGSEANPVLDVTIDRARTITANFQVVTNVYFVDVGNVGQAEVPYDSWTTAATNIQDAIDLALVNAANDPGLAVEIRVAAGMYPLTAPVTIGANQASKITVTAVDGAEATWLDGGYATRVLDLNAANTIVEGFTIQHGQETFGAGASVSAGKVRYSVFRNNRATGVGGGGAYLASANSIVENSLFYGNTATNNALLGGGGVYMVRGQLRFCTIVSNAASKAGGVGLVSNNDAMLLNSIVYSNTSDDANDNVDRGASAVVAYTMATPLQTGDGNIDTPPVFVSAAEDNYRVTGDSPTIDAASTNYAWLTADMLDLDGRSRVIAYTSTVAKADMGAYELPPPAFTAQGTPINWYQGKEMDPEDYGLEAGDWDGLDFVDSDGDGMLNWEEYLAGTDPLDPESLLTILSVTIQSGGVPYVEWLGGKDGPVQPYVVQRSFDIANPAAWVDMDMTSQNQDEEYYDWTGDPGADAKAFYRVIVPPPPAE